MMPPRTPYTYNFAHMCPGMYSGDPASRWVHQGSDMAHLQHILMQVFTTSPQPPQPKKKSCWSGFVAVPGLVWRSDPGLDPSLREAEMGG